MIRTTLAMRTAQRSNCESFPLSLRWTLDGGVDRWLTTLRPHPDHTCPNLRTRTTMTAWEVT